MHFQMHIWITIIGWILVLCCLFPLTYEYSPREYYAPSLIGENQSARWVKIHQPRQVDNSRYGDQFEFKNDPEQYNNNNGQDGRHFRPETIFRITETLGALNTVGRYLVNMTRSGDGENNKISQDVPNALYTISKNVLGRNVTDTIAPLVREALPVQDQNQDQHSAEDKNGNDGENDGDDDDNPRYCTTPEGLSGYCDDLSDCPQLLLNLGNLRQSLCFKSLFVPGVCCPKGADSPISTTTRKPYPPVIYQTTSIKPIKLSPVTSYTTRKPPINIPTLPKPPINIPSLPLNTPAPTFVPSIPDLPLEGNFVDPEDCGQPESAKYRVVGGEEALPGRWPWMAAIFLHGSRRTEFWCGGSLVTASYVLTAAHCTRDSRQRPFAARQFTVRLGDIDLKRDDEPSAPVTLKVSEIKAHPEFSRVGFYNDIALLKLEKPARKSKYVIPLCLPPPEVRSETFAGKRTTVVGWGTTYYGGKESTVQRQAILPIWRNEDCNQAYFQPITSNFICAGYSEGGTDACQGDSGGPLMLHWDARWIQVGVVSFGNKCGEPGYPGVYTRVTQYLDWIKDNTRN
ncbi:unnamed protein product [Brassicogethes aeneus]|uniref:Proclotting enzyme n=1 Tax=Brassicogethes aeneus TaxID=1431903 RepID=A0A9P0FLL1_BRAAE|nr:unnamed protein product [Brassicogethes aeneus]